MANIGDLESLSGGGKLNLPHVYSFQELIPEFDQITQFLDETRQSRFDEHMVGKSGIDDIERLRTVKLPASSQVDPTHTFGTLLDEAQKDLFPKLKSLTDDQKQQILVKAQEQFKRHSGASAKERFNQILSGRKYGGYGGTLLEENILGDSQARQEWTRQGLERHGFGSGQEGIKLRNIVPDNEIPAWIHELDKNWRDFQGTSGKGEFKARGAEQLAKQLEPFIVNSDVFLKRMTPQQLIDIAKSGTTISGHQFYDNSGAIIPALRKNSPGLSGVDIDTAKVIDDGTGNFTYRPNKQRFNPNITGAGDPYSANHVSLEGVDPIKAAKLYTGQKLGQWEFPVEELGSTVDQLISNYRLKNFGSLDTPLAGGIGHWGGWLTSPISDYRGSSEPELRRAISEGQLIQESPAVFDSNKTPRSGSSVTIRSDYLGPNYFNRTEIPWNYAVNSSVGGSYGINAQPALWETYFGSDAQRYPTSYVKLGSYGQTIGNSVIKSLAEGIDNTGNPLTPEQNSELAVSARQVLRSNPLLDSANNELLSPGVRQNPTSLATQIAEGHSIYTHPGNPYSPGWDGKPKFGLGLHMGVHSGIPANPAASQTYEWLAGPQESVFKGNNNSRWSGPFNIVKSDPIYTIGENGQLQISAAIPDQTPFVSEIYKKGLAGDPEWLSGFQGKHPTFNIAQTIQANSTSRPWTAIGDASSTSDKVITLAPPTGGSSRYDPIDYKWSSGFKLDDYPTRAFLPIDPNNPNAGWKEAFSNFEKFGLGELSGKAKSWNELEPYVIDWLKRTPNLTVEAFAGVRPSVDVDSLDRLKRFFEHNVRLTDREAFEIASKGNLAYEQRFGNSEYGPGFKRLYPNQHKDILENPNSTVWTLRKSITTGIMNSLTNSSNYTPETAPLAEIKTYDQLNAFIQSIKYTPRVGFSSSFIPGADPDTVRNILKSLTNALSVPDDKSVRATPATALQQRYLPGGVERTYGFATTTQPSVASSTDFSQISANSPKAAILASKDLSIGTEFFNEEQKKLFIDLAKKGLEGSSYAKEARMRPGFARLDMFKKTAQSFVNVAKGVMPSAETARFAEYLYQGRNAEKFTQNMVTFATNYHKLTPATREAVDAIMLAKLGQKFTSFISKAGAAMAIVAAPFEAKHRQDAKMARWEKDIEKNGNDLSQGEILALAEMQGVISGLENIPNFLTFGEYDAAMGYRESGLFSGMQKDMESLGREGRSVRRSPYHRIGFKTVNNAGTQYEEPEYPTSEIIKDLTQ